MSSVLPQRSHRLHLPRVRREQCGNVWVGWLEFSGPRGTKKTGEETSRPNRDAVAYWTSGLEMIYLEGALYRARYTKQEAREHRAATRGSPTRRWSGLRPAGLVGYLAGASSGPKPLSFER